MGHRVLVVDDDEDVRESLREGLSDLGFEVVLAVDGQEAIQILSKEGHGVEAVVCDLVMPRVGGGEFLIWNQSAQMLPVIILSGHVTTSEHRKYLNLGASCVLEKPMELKLLCELLKRCLAGRTP